MCRRCLTPYLFVLVGRMLGKKYSSRWRHHSRIRNRMFITPSIPRHHRLPCRYIPHLRSQCTRRERCIQDPHFRHLPTLQSQDVRHIDSIMGNVNTRLHLIIISTNPLHLDQIRIGDPIERKIHSQNMSTDRVTMTSIWRAWSHF